MNDRLLAYIARTLAADEGFEEELFTNEELARDASRLVATFAMMRDRAKQSPLCPVITKEELAVLEAHHRVTKHRPIDGVIRSKIADEDFVIGIVSLETTPTRIDFLLCTPTGEPYFRVHDAPFERETREVILQCQRDVALAQGSLIVKVLDDRGSVLAEVAIENEPASK